MLNQFDPKKRVTQEYMDEMHIYRARIVSSSTPEDDRLEVRILPHMIGLTDYLPKYPSFFQGQVIHGFTEKDDKDQADCVWVAALPDFTVGYVLGLANNYEGYTQPFSRSFNYKGWLDKFTEIGIAVPYIDYKDLLVQYWNSNYLEMVNVRYGDKYIVQSTGNMIILQKDQIYLRVGSGDSEKDGKINYFSAIQLKRDSIDIFSTVTRFHGKVSFGPNGINLASIASLIPIQVQGATIHPIDGVTA